MTRALRLLFVTGALAMAARGAVGCATNDAGIDPVTDDAGEEATVMGDATAPDSAETSDAGADVIAPKPSCSADGWCYSTLPGDDDYDASALPPDVPGVKFKLRGVWVDADQHPWAVSASGHVMHFDGSTWHVEMIATQPLYAVWGWGTTDVWVAGDRGLVLHGSIASGGAVTFTPVTIGTTQTIAHITGRSATDVWAIADGLVSYGTLDRVFRLDAAGSAFVPTTVRGPFTDSKAKLRLSTLWTAGTDIWTAGYTTTCTGPSPCSFREELVALKWNGDAPDGGAADAGDGGTPAWDAVPLLRDYSNLIPAATSTNDGVQLIAIRGNSDEGYVARIARDDSKLDGGPLDPDGGSGISHEGAYAWTNELAESFGSPRGILVMSQNDAWLVGLGGMVRHYDGKAWQLVHLSLTNVTPLLDDLYDISASTAPSGARNIWIVGDNVAIHRTEQP